MPTRQKNVSLTNSFFTGKLHNWGWVCIILSFVIISVGCSKSESDSDADALKPMVETVGEASKQALADSDISRVEWLAGPVLSSLVIESKIIRSGGVDKLPLKIRVKVKKRNLIHLGDYNDTLAEILPEDDFDSLMELREKYKYAKFFDDEEQK